MDRRRRLRRDLLADDRADQRPEPVELRLQPAGADPVDDLAQMRIDPAKVPDGGRPWVPRAKNRVVVGSDFRTHRQRRRVVLSMSGPGIWTSSASDSRTYMLRPRRRGRQGVSFQGGRNSRALPRVSRRARGQRPSGPSERSPGGAADDRYMPVRFHRHELRLGGPRLSFRQRSHPRWLPVGCPRYNALGVSRRPWSRRGGSGTLAESGRRG